MRIPVPLRRAYRLINHGPTTLITSAHAGRTNVMAAAWVMPLDLDPPKVAAVIASETFTRELVEASGEFGVCVPTAADAARTYALGSSTGRDEDKIGRFGLEVFSGASIGAPLVSGCAAWLECKVVPEPDVQRRYDLFVGDVVAAWADGDLFVDGAWRFEDDLRRTIHHAARGLFYATGLAIDVRIPERDRAD